MTGQPLLARQYCGWPQASRAPQGLLRPKGHRGRQGPCVFIIRRILTEAAIFADKCSIAEELTRLKSHLDQMAAIIASAEGPEGKKLDFLVQEMNREANTIGSKANDIEVTNLMLMVKAGEAVDAVIAQLLPLSALSRGWRNL